jgi:hypothetical protein
MKKSKKNSLPIMEIGGALAGAVATGVVKNLLEKSAPNLSPMIKGAVVTGAGAFIAMQKSPLLKGAGLAMVSVGGYDLVKAFMPNAIGAIDDIFVSAPADQYILSAPADQSVISGDDVFLGENDSINGDEFMGADEYSINGDENF